MHKKDAQNGDQHQVNACQRLSCRVEVTRRPWSLCANNYWYVFQRCSLYRGCYHVREVRVGRQHRSLVVDECGQLDSLLVARTNLKELGRYHYNHAPLSQFLVLYTLPTTTY